MGTPTGTADPALDFVDGALQQVPDRLGGIDREAMALVLLLHRVTNVVVYDLESTVHRPAGWSWSAFRAVFTLWVSGPLEPSRLAALSGMSRQAVSALAGGGERRIEQIFRDHNRRESEWAATLSPDERATLTGLLAKLAAASRQPWVSHRF
jgi:hypothetical protein